MKATKLLFFKTIFTLLLFSSIQKTGACNSNFYFGSNSVNTLHYYFWAADSTMTNYIWDFGDGSSSYAMKPAHQYSSGGTYRVQLIVWDSVNNCSDTTVQTIGINGCTANANFYILNSLGTLSLHNISTNATSYKWYIQSKNGIDSSTNQHFSKSFSNCDSVKVTLYASNGTCSTHMSKYWIPMLVSANFEIVPDTTQTYSAILIDKSKYAGTPNYLWEFGDGDTSHAQTPTHTYPGTNVYGLCLILTYANCYSYHCDTLAFDSSGQILAMMPFSLKVIKEGQKLSSIQQVHDTQVKLYPNPAGNRILFESSSTIKTVRIISAIGQVVLNETILSNQADLNLENLKSGFYTLESTDIHGNKQTFTFVHL